MSLAPGRGILVLVSLVFSFADGAAGRKGANHFERELQLTKSFLIASITSGG